MIEAGELCEHLKELIFNLVMTLPSLDGNCCAVMWLIVLESPVLYQFREFEQTDAARSNEQGWQRDSGKKGNILGERRVNPSSAENDQL